ncbi:MAG: PAS domain-containing sensor histidine kinase [Halorubrum sp.]
MPSSEVPRPGIAHRRPQGDPTRIRIESAGESEIPVDELPQDAWLDAVHPADRDRLREALKTTSVDIAYRVEAGGEYIWVQERARQTDAGDVVGYLFSACDRVQRQRQLKQQRERLDEFASVVSHDLRNPLSVAVGNLELASEFEGEAAKNRLDRVHDALDRMDALISDLLSLAREGRSVEATAETELRAVVDSAWATVGSAADAELIVEDELPRISCDRNRLQQALENLFRNSVEHGVDVDTDDDSDRSGSNETPQRDDIADGVFGSYDPDANNHPEYGVRIFVGGIDDGFYISDDGPGIDPDTRESVFEPGHTTTEDGTGFGLAIVERIAEAHGWSVSVGESRADGARFEFTGVDIVDVTDTSASDEYTATGSGRSSAE